jgi:hypothetical protein
MIKQRKRYLRSIYSLARYKADFWAIILFYCYLQNKFMKSIFFSLIK